MMLHALREAPPSWLGEALERFEESFHYPLGEGMSFRISHGQSYLPFFQAMGEATVWVAEKDGDVLGTLAAVIRTLHLPAGERRQTAYLCDLKLAPHARTGRTLARLTRSVTQGLQSQGIACAYAVIMGGTERTPANYTGRLGIPEFVTLSDFAVWKIMADRRIEATQASVIGSLDEVADVHSSLNGSCLYASGGQPSIRSLMQPVPLLGAGNEACGVIEDTRRGKRLWLDTGDELRVAHLSRFAYANIEAGSRLIRNALAFVAKAGLPAMFVAIPSNDAPAFAKALSDLSAHQALATVYGCGLPNSDAWRIDTSEI